LCHSHTIFACPPGTCQDTFLNNITSSQNTNNDDNIEKDSLPITIKQNNIAQQICFMTIIQDNLVSQYQKQIYLSPITFPVCLIGLLHTILHHDYLTSNSSNLSQYFLPNSLWSISGFNILISYIFTKQFLSSHNRRPYHQSLLHCDTVTIFF